MRTIKILIILLVFFSTSASSLGRSRDEAIASLRTRFVELSRLVPPPEIIMGPAWMPYERASDALLEEPRGLLLEAIDRVISEGSMEERTGAVGTYTALVGIKKEKLNPAYHPLLLQLLAKDDLQSPAYTGTIAGALSLYPSGETAKALMNVAARAPAPEIRQEYILRTGGLLHMSLQIALNTPPLRVEKILSDFEAWFAKNKDRISFDKHGNLRLAGGEASVERKELAPEDRSRIREDPVCVLRLLDTTMSDAVDDDVKNARVPELNSKCGVALWGPEGAAYMHKMTAGNQAGSEENSIEMEAVGASLAGKYPAIEAGLLAAVYVVAYEKDPAALKLAKEVLIQFSPEDVKRVANYESSEIRKKAQAFANETKQ